ncbi:MAG: hypothetical protein ACRD3D_05755 [Terriglobia bacterium]
MKGLEEQLRSMLRREEPPASFTERVLARVRGKAKPRKALRRFVDALVPRPMPRWAAAAAALACVLVALSYTGYRGREQRRGELATAEVMVALRITSAQLNATFQKTLLSGPAHVAPAQESSSQP